MCRSQNRPWRWWTSSAYYFSSNPQYNSHVCYASAIDIAGPAVSYRAALLHPIAGTLERDMDHRLLGAMNSGTISQRGSFSQQRVRSSACFSIFRIGCGERVWLRTKSEKKDASLRVGGFACTSDTRSATVAPSEAIVLSAGAQM